jgi:hypothetical protein
MYDIVIPIGPNDIEVFTKQIEYTKRNCIGYRKIYVIAASSVESLVREVPDTLFIDESTFPFDLHQLHTYSGSDSSKRNGWYFQQLLKLYSGSILPSILDRWLVIDTDTFFLKPVTFIQEDRCLYATGVEHWFPYFRHMDRLIPGLTRVKPMSGICHHMIFEQKYVKELMERVEHIHQKPFWLAFMSNVSVSDYHLSGASEYEIYFNYMLTYHPECIQIRPLRWANVSTLDLGSDCDYISYHHYMRNTVA